jgi:hypothetical protein
MEIEDIILSHKIINEIEKDQMNPILDIKEKDQMNPINIFESQKQEMIDMLKKIMEKTFESKISNLEKRAKNQFSILKTTSTTTKYITNLTIQMQKSIMEKKIQNKRLKFSKSSKKMMPQKTLFNSKHSDNISKSPLRSTTSRGGLYKTPNIKNSLLQRMRSDAKNKSPYTLKQKKNDNPLTKSPISSSRLNTLNNKSNLINPSPSKRLVTYNQKSPINLNKMKRNKNNNISITTEDFSVTSEFSNPSVFISKKNYESPKRNIEKSNGQNSSKKNIGLIGRMKKKNLDQNQDVSSRFKKKSGLIKSDKENSRRKLTGNKSREKMSRKSSKRKLNSNNLISNTDLSLYSSKNSIDLNLETDKMNKLETNLKNEENIINNDPLLISNLKDFELAHLSKDPNKDVLNDSQIKPIPLIKDLYHTYEYNVFNENLKDILIFLTNKDILQFKNCSKALHKSVIEYLIKQFDIERNNFFSKQNELNLSLEEIQQKPNINDLKFTKGAYRAISLLNEGMLNDLFKNENKPNKEIYVIYKIFFLSINYEEITKNAIDSDDEFWEKCKNYFLGYNGKIGDLLSDIIDNKKVVLNGDNIYKIYKLINKNIHKIIPAHFSKICTTTGLFVFFIKDILDFLGFSSDQKIQKNSYWSYSEIINLIDAKIDALNKLQAH